MLRHKLIDRVCCVILMLTLLVSVLFVGAAATGRITEDTTIGYETRLFDQSRVHTIDIVMNDWDAFLQTATSEVYASCHLVIDGESYKNVGIRGKGNTSLSSVAAYGNNRYSFKVEFDQYQTGLTYHGLDKLSLNNLIQDNTYMKDYFAYTLMNRMGVAAPLCSFVQINVNGEPWGLYLAVEGVEDAFLQRNYGKDHGELYKPDSMSFGGGRGNGRDFDMDEMTKKFGFSFGNDDGQQSFTMPDMGSTPQMPTGGTMPDMGSAPRMPTGGTMPDMNSAPPMPSGTMPDMNSTPQMPTGGTMPDMGSAPQMPSGNAMPDMGGMGGGMGMGSDDVKLQYTDDDPASYSNIFNNAKTEITEADQNRLIAALKALGEGDTSVVNTDAVIRYMAVHNFLCNDDSYTGMMVHNYYLYEEDGVLAMIPWDYNLAYGTMTGSNATSSVNADIDSLVSGSSNDRPMADWITASEEYMAQYRAAYQEFITTAFDSGWFAEEIDRVTAMIAPYVQNDPTAFCTYEEFQTGAETLKQFCLKRAQSVTRQLNGEDTRVDASALTLSDMGTMDNMGSPGGDRGGFERPDQKSGREERNRSAVAPAPGATSEMPVFDMPAATLEASDASGEPRASEAPNVDETRARPGFEGGFDMANLSPGSNASQGWIWVAVCAVLLAAALVFAKFYKTNR